MYLENQKAVKVFDVQLYSRSVHVEKIRQMVSKLPPFSALTLLFVHQEEHPACRN